ncbi:RNA polymerase sigma factor [Actinotalea sp. M2MS4P-6]|uniref:RNA polymerase sigma factor n=1 Tax=Actinotalea sp. M2MS4P-6 TaxID=2983762 RepID=UPI0021E501D5|nr:RNA polymerase sigma factor [Actinotalea sp. M2MS4P-6]MCV2393096.1 RNA polymerase sigma factor [Actinotalea sp. M2MS4P-6]
MDAEVLERARAGSGEAFGVIYAELAGPVSAYLRAKGVAEHEDLTSEVFIAVFQGLPGFEGDVVGFRSWVFTIAHRRVVDTWRRAGRRPEPVPYEPEDDARTAASAEVEALDRVGQERALALLDQLTPEQREVLVLRIVADLPIDEVAVVVGRPPGAVKALQHRGLAALRRILAKEGVSP